MLKALLAAVVALLLLVVAWPFTVVPAGFRGIVTVFGRVEPEVLGEGLHLVVPWARVVTVDVRIARFDSEREEASSSDLQTVATSITVNYHPVAEQLPQTYRQVGLHYEQTIIAPAVLESFKAVTARYTAEQLITRREEVRSAIKDLLGGKITERTAGGVQLDEISITNFAFSRVFNDAIESKQQAEQLALKAQRDLDRIQVEAKQQVARAEAEAESLRLQREAITPELLQLRAIEVQRTAIEKWNGVLPQTYAGQSLPFIGLGGSPVKP